jgi:predicted MarR family transcription regulator
MASNADAPIEQDSTVANHDGLNNFVEINAVDPIDKSIMELEELANKLRWMKGVLECGIRWSNDAKPSWKFLTKK